MKKYELLPIYDSKKSFYHKAIIEEENENIKLYSYNTLVCTLSHNDIIIDNFNGVYIQYNYNIVKNVNNKINFNKLIDRYLFNYDFSVIESSPLFSYFFTDEIKKMSFNILDSNENNIFMFLELSKALKKYDLKEYYQD